MSDRFISSFAPLAEAAKNSSNLKRSLEPNDLWPVLRILVLIVDVAFSRIFSVRIPLPEQIVPES